MSYLNVKANANAKGKTRLFEVGSNF